VFARGALAESWTFAWYPLVVVGMWRTLSRRRLVWYLPAAVAGLVLSHSVMALYFLGFCAALCAAGWRWHGWRAAGLAALGVALGFGLALWFVLPQQAHFRDVWVSVPAAINSEAAYVHATRIRPLDLVVEPAFLLGGPPSIAYLDRMRFNLGAGQFLMLGAAVWAVRASRTGRARATRLRALGRLVLGAWAVYVVFMLWPAAFLAVLPRQFGYIQFAWRLLGLTAFLASLGLAVFARRARLGPRATWALVAAAALIVLFVPPSEREPWTTPAWDAATVLAPDRLREEGKLGFTIQGEYLPRDFDLSAHVRGDLPPALFEAPRVRGGALVAWERDGLDCRATVAPGDECEVTFPIVYYDFYRAEAPDGRRLATYSADGFLAVRVPADVTAVSVTRGLTAISYVGLAATLVAAAVTVFASRRRRRQAIPRDPPFLLE
jgi:hypothetical protein